MALSNNVNSGYQSSSVNQTICVDTVKLRSYADRLKRVNNRLVKLDTRMDDLYQKIGLRDLFQILQADLITGSNGNITNCATFLDETANDFDNTERNVAGRF